VIGNSSAEQDVGVITGAVKNSQVKVDISGELSNVAATIAGSAKSVQEIGSIDVSEATGDSMRINARGISGASASLLGAAETEQQIGDVTGADVNASAVILNLGDISGVGVGVLGKGKGVERLGVISTGGAVSNINITASADNITVSGVGSDSTASIVFGSVSGQSVSGDTLNITSGSIDANSFGIGSNASIAIGEVSGVSQFNANISVHNVTSGSISLDSSSIIQVGYDVSRSSVSISDDITTGDITSHVDVAAAAKSEVVVGSIFSSLTRPARIQIITGNLSSTVAGAIGGTNGIFIGNIYSGGGNVSVVTGDQTAIAAACIGNACLSEITGAQNCIQIGNINAPAHCGNEDIFEQALQEVEKLAAEAAAEAKKIADEAAAEAHKLYEEAKHYCRHHWWC
jgi:hypothetical protein